MVEVFIVGSVFCLVAHQDARYRVCQSDYTEIVHGHSVRVGPTYRMCKYLCVVDD